MPDVGFASQIIYTPKQMTGTRATLSKVAKPATTPADGKRTRRAETRASRTEPSSTNVSDDELKAVALRIPRLFHAAKSNGGPTPDEIKRLMGGIGLGPRHFNALRHVMAEGPMSVSALSVRLGVALSTASLMVAELSRAGLLERIEDDEDRRRTIVRVAPERAAAADAFLSRRLDPLRRALERLSPAERVAFAHGLDVLTEELCAAAPGSCPDMLTHANLTEVAQTLV
jgi:DNA-binding MarR family transcriptional regulator